MGRIFISYRRADGAAEARHLSDILASRFGKDRLFMDVTTINPGADFVEELHKAIDQSDVLIAIIGDNWLNATDETGSRRLDDPEDLVRLEIASALKRGIPVIPVLIKNARIPKANELPPSLAAISRRQASELRHEHFSVDINQLVTNVEQVLLDAEVKRGLTARPDLSQWVKRLSPPPYSKEALAVISAMETSLARNGIPLRLSTHYLLKRADRQIREESSRRGELIPHSLELRSGPDVLATLIRVAEQYGTVPDSVWPNKGPAKQETGLLAKLVRKSAREVDPSQMPAGTTWDSLDAQASRYKIRPYRLSKYEDIPVQLGLGRPIVARVPYVKEGITEYKKSLAGLRTYSPERYDALIPEPYDALILVAFNAKDSSVQFVDFHGLIGDSRFGKLYYDVALSVLAFDNMWAVDVPINDSRS
jgi:TIR domain